VAHGGRLLFGSDTPSGLTYGNPPGLNGYLELERLAEAGIPLDRLFRAATIEVAKAFRLDRRYGTVEPGKVANLLLLRANPLETVEAYDAIDLVVSRGEVLDRAALAAEAGGH
jgi:imidazolonepropionase-like amidohydrolase